MKESEEHFKLAVTDAPFPIIIHAEGGEILNLSKACTDLTGYDQSEIENIDDCLKKLRLLLM